jgi:hypothetical protein
MNKLRINLLKLKQFIKIELLPLRLIQVYKSKNKSREKLQNLNQHIKNKWELCKINIDRQKEI